MTSKEQKIKQIKEFIKNNPSLNSNESLDEVKLLGLGIRRQDFQTLFRKEKSLPQPTKAKREASIPIKFRKVKPKITKPKITKPKITKPTIQLKLPIIPKIPFEETKFGKIVKDIENIHNISEKKAIERTRVLLKIPREDFRRLNQKDLFVLEQHGY